MAKPVTKLTPNDWGKHPVWTFDLRDETGKGRDETWMVPVTELPVSSLSNCGSRANASLANGTPIMAVLFSVDLKDARYNELFMRASFWIDPGWWHLESVHPFRGGHLGSDLADKLGLPIESVFPVKYDISPHAIGVDEVLKGFIYAVPREKISPEERMKLALQKMRERRL